MASGGIIVLAEDDPRLIRLYVAALSVAGFNVLTATDGHSALNLLTRVTPHLVILDIMMPQLNGIETCKRARKIIGDDIPILFLSVLNRADILRDCLAAGGDDYLIKLDSIESLIERVKTWGHHAQRQGLAIRRKTLLQSVNDQISSAEQDSPATQPQKGSGQG